MDYTQNTGSSRPFSTTNPFRAGGFDSNAQTSNTNNNWSQYDTTPNMNNGIQTSPGFNQTGNSFGSGFSNVSEPFASRPAMVKRQSTNPFLDETETSPEQPIYSPPQQHTFNNSSTPPPPQPRNTQQSMTAREEKDQLRQRYMEEANVSGNRNTGANGTLPPPPPYYEESTDNKPKNRYPMEKQRAGTGNNGVERHRTHSGTHRNHNYDNDHDDNRPHRHHSSNERSRRHHHSNEHREGSRSSQKKKDKKKSAATISKGVDTIDKLDVTGLFGGSFHHDGPFDACTPHRNKNTNVAPVLAFPADGPNSTIGGATTKKSAMNEVFGVDDVDDDSFLYTTKQNTSKDALRSSVANNIKNLDTKNKTQLVHGVETGGLGSSTFLDGAPASNQKLMGMNTVSQNLGIQRGNTISYKTTDSSRFRQNYNNNGSNGVAASDLRRNLSTNSRPAVNRYNSAGSSNRQFNRDEPRYPRVHSAGVSQEDFRRNYNGNNNNSYDDDDDDVYLSNNNDNGVRFDSSASSGLKKSSTSSKFLKRVKSLKVGGRKH
ncbi:protein Pal1p [Monosporozyma servazzii]